ncbi:MAG: hypothetical protein U9Q58_08510, partial [Pseudomonadota bacterium]|nr:hypothetical protein [Pseudomonadota bacterium]
MMLTKSLKSARLRTWVIVFLSLTLIGLGSMLFYTSYRTRVRMQESTLSRWSHDSELRAAALSYFYTDRLNELSSLAGDSTITSFFLNKSLGMSMRYGLRSTLNNIESLFDRLIETHCLDGNHIYQCFILLGHEGELLSTSRDNQSEVAIDRLWSQYLTPQTETVSILAQKRKHGGVEVIISAPIFFNKNYSGQILAWIDFPLVYNNFINVIPDDERSACVVNREGLHFTTHQDDLKINNCSHDAAIPDTVMELSVSVAEHEGDLLVLRGPVVDTPFFLVETVSKSSLDYLSPHKFIAYLSLFAVAILVISGLLLRYLVVHARFEEVVRRENEVAEKNLELEKEITHRKKAEQDLLAAHNKLESRVEERTRELREAQAELINRALEEGRAQQAAMVLHNIGNAITPVSVYLEQAQSMRMLEICHFQERCFAELKENSENLTSYISKDPRGCKIFTTLEELIETLPKNLTEQQVLLEKIGVTINHVGEIISLQQSYAGGGAEIKEVVDLNGLIRDALSLQEDLINKRHIVVKVNLAPELPRVLLDKNRLNQVFVNLIKNSCEAIDQNESSAARNLEIVSCLTGDQVRIII